MSQSNQQGGFRQWLASQGGNLRQQFALPRDDDGSISWPRFLGQIGMGAAFGPVGGMVGRQLFNGNSFPQMQQYGRIAGDSFGRMFDGDNTTGFFNNPSWGGGPRNVAEGHRDFVGPPSPGGGPTTPSDPYGDPRNMGPPAPTQVVGRMPPQGSEQGGFGYGPRTQQGNWISGGPSMGMNTMSRLWGSDPYSTGLLFNDQRQVI